MGNAVDPDIKSLVNSATYTKEAWASLKALVPSDASAFEDLNIKADVHIRDHLSAATFITATRNVQTEFVAMDPEHHYCKDMTYMYRVLRGIADTPDLNPVRLKY